MRKGSECRHTTGARAVKFGVTKSFLLVLLIAGVCLAATRADAGQDTPPRDVSAADSGSANEQMSPWFFLLGFSNAHPVIQSEQLIDRYFDPIISTLAPTYDEVTTVGDLRDDFLLWVPYVGVGRMLSDKWAAFAQVGYAGGKVRTEANDRSLLLLPLHTDFEIKRAAFYGGVGLDYFPFGMPELKEYHGVMERLRAAKPNIGTRLTWTNATYEAKVKVGFKPFDNFLNYKENDEWLLPSASANIGVDVPLNKRSQISLNASYNRFNDERDDFEGPSYTIIWKRYFKAKRK